MFKLTDWRRTQVTCKFETVESAEDVILAIEHSRRIPSDGYVMSVAITETRKVVYNVKPPADITRTVELPDYNDMK